RARGGAGGATGRAAPQGPRPPPRSGGRRRRCSAATPIDILRLKGEFAPVRRTVLHGLTTGSLFDISSGVREPPMIGLRSACWWTLGVARVLLAFALS